MTATNAIQEVAGDLRDAARAEEARYANGEERPLGGYAVLLSIYGAVLALLTGLVRRRGGLPDGLHLRRERLIVEQHQTEFAAKRRRDWRRMAYPCLSQPNGG